MSRQKIGQYNSLPDIIKNLLWNIFLKVKKFTDIKKNPCFF